MKVALVLCPYWHRGYPAYGPASLSAQLKQRGHEVRFLDLNLEMGLAWSAGPRGAQGAPEPGDEWSDAETAREIVLPVFRRFLEAKVRTLLQQGFKVFGFSVYYSNAALSLEVARMIKAEDPSAAVVFGGPQCFEFERCLELVREPAVDAVAFGEADLSFPALVGSLERHGALRPSPGILLRDDPSTWTPTAPPVCEMDELPFADYSGHRLRLYPGGKLIHSCRGCVRKCVFCSEWRAMRYRQMSGRRIFAEIEHQLDRDPDVREFMFADSLVNGVMRSLGTFCDLAQAGGLDFSWRGLAIARPEMTPEFAARMRGAGCRDLCCGIESGSARVLKALGKDVPPELNARVLRNLRGAGIGTTTLWMAGFPTETEEDFEDSVEFVRANAGSISSMIVNLFSINQMMDAESMSRYGIEPSDHHLFWRTRDGRNTFPRRVERVRRLARAAAQAGIEVCFEKGSEHPEPLEARLGAKLAAYERWRGRAVCA